MSASSPNILYVEDDMLSRRVMQMLVSKILGYKDLAIFEDSSNFMERVRALPSIPDIIFLDVQIGPHDGYEMLQMLRSEPNYQDSIIIAMTANVMSHDVEQLQTAGFSGLIGKPIIKEIFPDLLKKIMQGEAIWYVP